ncbi:MAG TPA: response regulator [Bacteroidota bacterium]|nr:response regulator [Bacteroidota bacterium]
MNILVVDDESEYRILVGGFLKDQGWAVFLAGDGQEGLDILFRETIDIIVSDIYMPVMDGLKFHKAVRSNEKFSKIPFLFVSAYDDRYTMEAVKDAKLDGFSRKGRPVSDLKAWIEYLTTPVDRRPPAPPGERPKPASDDWRRTQPRPRRH